MSENRPPSFSQLTAPFDCHNVEANPAQKILRRPENSGRRGTLLNGWEDGMPKRMKESRTRGQFMPRQSETAKKPYSAPSFRMLDVNAAKAILDKLFPGM
jgi:hypothetical protein